MHSLNLCLSQILSRQNGKVWVSASHVEEQESTERPIPTTRSSMEIDGMLKELIPYAHNLAA